MNRFMIAVLILLLIGVGFALGQINSNQSVPISTPNSQFSVAGPLVTQGASRQGVLYPQAWCPGLSYQGCWGVLQTGQIPLR